MAGDPGEGVAAYKRILAAVIDRRPSGTRQRLAAALAKNRSFVSQITSPQYHTPIPASHIDIIFDVCHFSPAERRSFMEAYGAAHPRRLPAVKDASRMKQHTVYLPDLGDTARNAKLHALVSEFVREIALLVESRANGRTRR